MTYRLLPINEWPRLDPLFDAHGQTPPPPSVASCAVAENSSGEIVGCLVLQITLHMEPLILTTPHASFARLQETLESAIRERYLENNNHLTYYSFSDSDEVDRMATKVGMKRHDGRIVWEKEV